MAEETTDVIFVYSELQIAAANQIYKARGKKFVCGLVAVGITHKKFSKMIKPSAFDAMLSQYADTKIVYRTTKALAKYTSPSVTNAN